MNNDLMSSPFDRIYQSLHTRSANEYKPGYHDEFINDAATVLSQWWRRISKMRVIRTNLDIIQNELNICHHNLLVYDSFNDYEVAQAYVNNPDYLKSMSSLLEKLPRDPYLKQRNKAARNVKTLSAALLIHKFPSRILVPVDWSRDDEDNIDVETKHCVIASKLLILCLKFFLSRYISDKVYFSDFRRSLLGYRQSMRFFLDALDKWKKLDRLRMASSLKQSYMEAYAILEGIKRQSYQGKYEIAQQTIDDMRAKFKSLLGEDASKILKDYEEEATTLIPHVAFEPVTLPEVLLTASNSEKGTSGARLPMSPQDSTATMSLPSSLKSVSLERSLTSCLDNSQLKMLLRLLELSEVNFEFLIYNITLDPNFHFKQPQHVLDTFACDSVLYYTARTSPPQLKARILQPLTSDEKQSLINIRSLASTRPEDASAILRKQMLRCIGDRLVCSLRTSPITYPLQQLAVESMVLLYTSNKDIVTREISDPEQTPRQGDVVTTGRKGSTYTAKVTNLNVPPNSSSSSSQSGACTIDVEYLADGIIEKNVQIDRIKLSKDPSDPLPLLEILTELTMQIKSLVPNRVDVHRRLETGIDLRALREDIVRGGLAAGDTILQVMTCYLTVLQELQSPIRSEQTQRMLAALARRMQEETVRRESKAVTATTATTVRPLAWSQEMVELLPEYFEYVNVCIEDLRREMINFYLRALRPVFTARGRGILSDYLLEKTQLGSFPINKTSHWLHSQVVLGAGPGDAAAAGGGGRDAFLSDIRDAGLVTDLDSLGQFTSCISMSTTTSSTSFNNITTAGSSPIITSSNSSAAVATTSVTNLETVAPNIALLARGFVQLLSMPFRADSVSAVAAAVIPETLALDAGRLAALRDDVDVLGLQATLMILVKKTIAPTGIALREAEEVELYHRLDVLLRDPQTFRAHLATEIIRFITVKTSPLEPVSDVDVNEVCFQPMNDNAIPSNKPPGDETSLSVPVPLLVSITTTGPRPRQLQVGWESSLQRAVFDSITEGNPILSLINKRILRLLLRSLLGKSYEHLLPGYSLSSPFLKASLESILRTGSQLFSHNIQVYDRIYSSLLLHLAESLGNERPIAPTTTCTTATTTS